MSPLLNIAIDGPAGAGKSTVAKLLADKLSYVYIDTGAMYRALTWEALDRNTDVHNENALIDLLKQCDIVLQNIDGELKIFLNDKDVTQEIRSNRVTGHVSYVAKHAGIRKEMVLKQQKLAEPGGVVMDGRDIGTAVLPEADVKIFLTATVEERARRRHEENVAKGINSDFNSIKDDIARRDRIDSEREIAPLKKAGDAEVIDSTSLTIPEVTDRIYAIAVERDGAVE